jgi:hypothetical protein
MNCIRSIKTRVACASAALLLAACGGSDDAAAPAPPAGDGLTQDERDDRAASTSVAGLFAFAVVHVTGRTNETSEPRAIDGITAPVADDAEPMAVPL